MPKPQVIELGRALEIPILYEDRAVLAIDKPAGWMLVPTDWDRTARNLQLAITSSIRAGDFWARSQNLKFLRFVHRLDAETTGILLFAKSAGAVPVYSRLFESRQMEKTYFAVTEGIPAHDKWVSREPIGPDTGTPARMRVDHKAGKEAVTQFELLQRTETRALLRAKPLTGRTHQIRVHLAAAGVPVSGDQLYARNQKPFNDVFPLGLRAIGLSFSDPFSGRNVQIKAPDEAFAKTFGFKCLNPRWWEAKLRA